MMKNYNLPIYDKQREQIAEMRNHGMDWEKIYYGNGKSESDLDRFLENMRCMCFWDIEKEDWFALVRHEKTGEERKLSMGAAERNALISNGEPVNDLTIPTGRNTCWQCYRRYLLEEQKFAFEDVKAIEDSTYNIMRHMNINTKGDAVKGLVVGNVQSGKTANMAALMAMTADYGYNMFIVLSGSIESLRIQTLNRLLKDLNLRNCNLSWKGVSHPSAHGAIEDSTQHLDFEEGSSNRYLTVCLKNSSRLKNLIQWLHEDAKTMGNMKILVIDDESDQAGVNTKDIDSDERTRINELIVNLVSNNDESGNTGRNYFRCMNYVGYTATPYANLLNEAYEESLYPKNFIATLQVSKTYFGPQQIFGDRTSDHYRGLDIVRPLDDAEIRILKQIYMTGDYDTVPSGLENALCWFICCVAALRSRGFRKPLSMLVHTSVKIGHHEDVAACISRWLERNTEDIVQQCRDVWEEETGRFTADDLFEQYPDFAVEKENIDGYPEFDDFKENIYRILETGRQNIMLGDEGRFTYGEGIHLCIDNCKNNGVQEDGTYMRLAYPDKTNMPDFAPAFIVIGGATLSRGLTIEGLVSTYFARATKLGDTLMQMGRWFGYRRGYEIYPRIWISDNTCRQYEFLADMDSELREFISRMELFDRSPSEYAVAVRQSPSASLITLSSGNKMQGAVKAAVNYSGMRAQTQLFFEDEDILEENYNIAENFLAGLPDGKKGNGRYGESSYIWNDISFDYIYENLLSKYRFHEKLLAFGNIDAIRKWVVETTEKGLIKNWNVVLFGINRGAGSEIAGYEITKVCRTRKTSRPGTIDIGVLTDPSEKIADVNYDTLDESGQNMYDSFRTDQVYDIRKSAGMADVPSIVIYVVDKDSKISAKAQNRHDMNAACDIIGISVNIPGDKVNSDYTSAVMIDLGRFGNGTEGENDED